MSFNMKMPVSALQELLIKLGHEPEYKLISKFGPPHNTIFVYECKAMGMSETGMGWTKKSAKHQAASLMLQYLRDNGIGEETIEEQNQQLWRRCRSLAMVTLVKEMCDKYHLGSVQYTVSSKRGPAHMPYFVVQAVLGGEIRTGIGRTKKEARNLAAEQIYEFICEDLLGLDIMDFPEMNLPFDIEP